MNEKMMKDGKFRMDLLEIFANNNTDIERIEELIKYVKLQRKLAAKEVRYAAIDIIQENRVLAFEGKIEDRDETNIKQIQNYNLTHE